jgi:spore coat polysaccharide biosynthesis protein SpsF
MNIHCIIQARMGSSRFPGKIMKMIEDKVVLQHVVDRCRLSKYINKVIVATTNIKLDNVIEEYCINNDILYYRGDEKNVLERYYLTATKFNSDIIIRVTSDCPLIDYNVVDNMIDYFKENNLKFLQPKYFNGNNQKSRGGFPDGF